MGGCNLLPYSVQSTYVCVYLQYGSDAGSTSTPHRTHHRSQLEFVADNTSSVFDKTLQQDLTAWATRVTSTVNVYSVLNTIHGYLMGDRQLGGAIGVCQNAFYSAWLQRGGHFPLDDRQYYNDINAYLIDKIILQSQGAQYVSLC